MTVKSLWKFWFVYNHAILTILTRRSSYSPPPTHTWQMFCPWILYFNFLPHGETYRFNLFIFTQIWRIRYNNISISMYFLPGPNPLTESFTNLFYGLASNSRPTEIFKLFIQLWKFLKKWRKSSKMELYVWFLRLFSYPYIFAICFRI